MDKKKKYILGFIIIFIAATVCVFGLIKYEGMKKTPTPDITQI